MIILFGLAGSGKGTQGKALSEIFGWRTLSVGQVIRDTGRYADIVDRGGLIPDDDVIRLMNEQIERAEAEGFDVILDGYPRDEYQAKWLVDHIADQVQGAIILDVPKDELKQRLTLRATSEGRADDQDERVIDERFRVFEENIGKILPLLEGKGIPIAHVDGVGSPSAVTERLIATVEQMCPAATQQTTDVNGADIEKSYGE